MNFADEKDYIMRIIKEMFDEVYKNKSLAIISL